MREEEDEQMNILSNMGKDFGLISLFTDSDTLLPYTQFFNLFHQAVTAYSNFINIICFMNYFLTKHPTSSDDLKRALNTAKDPIEAASKDAKHRANLNTKQNLNLGYRISIGKYIDDATFQKALEFAKDKAAKYESQVDISYSFFLFSFILILFKIY
jgi:uncharacterized protein (DUF608 family)